MFLKKLLIFSFIFLLSSCSYFEKHWQHTNFSGAEEKKQFSIDKKQCQYEARLNRNKTVVINHYQDSKGKSQSSVHERDDSEELTDLCLEIRGWEKFYIEKKVSW